MRNALILVGFLLVGCAGNEGGVVHDDEVIVVTEDVSSPDSANKADLVGNRKENEACTFDWQCADDLGLICRPASGSFRCQVRGLEHDLCFDDDDCWVGACKGSAILSVVDDGWSTNVTYQAGRCVL